MISEELVGRARILIVDGEQANVRLLQRLLLTGGFTEVRGTTESQTALALVDEIRPDLVILDQNLPRVDGMPLLEALRHRCPSAEQIPFLILTADHSRATRERLLAGGAKDFIGKPLDRSEVLLRTRNALEARYLRLALKDETRAVESKLLHQAFHDSLTGLANRALFRERLEHATRRSPRGEGMAIALLDLDDFKLVNDTLRSRRRRSAAARSSRRGCRRASRGCDTVARIGGDEFAILLEGLQTDADAIAVVERIVGAMRQPVGLKGREIVVSASVGIAFCRGEDRVDELIRNADVAMYRAKDDGKGGYAVFEPAMYRGVTRAT